MKSIQKISLVLSLMAIGAVGCSQASTTEVKSDSLTQETASEVTNQETASDFSTQETASEVTNQEIASDFSSVLANSVVGQEVVLEGKIIGQMEDCYVFTDGTNKVLLHFEEETISYDPNNLVKISGVIEEGVIHDSHDSDAAKEHNLAMENTIMVETMEVITPAENS